MPNLSRNRLPSRFRRLDGALADLPVEEPMLLTELDGFLTGLLVLPEPIPPAEWMTAIWGMEADGVPPFDDPRDVEWFARAVAARQEEIARDLARGGLQPILDTDGHDGEVLWEYWIDGVAEALALRPEAWRALAEQPRTAAAAARLAMLMAVAREEGGLDAVERDAFEDRAVADLHEAVEALYAAQGGGTTAPALAPAKVGRNDACPCGSGRKHKRCCG